MIIDDKQLFRLPEGWVWTRLEEICSNEKNKGIEGSIPYLEIGNIDIATKKYSPGAKPSVKGALLSREGDILISRVRPTRGAVAITKEKEIQVSSALTILRPLLEIPSEYVHYFLAWNSIFLDFLGEKSTGTMYPTVKENFVLQYPISLPPLPEQRRIVTKIEELFTKLDAGVATLENAKVLLKAYRRAVIREACEGHLVKCEAELAEANNRDYETAESLLIRLYYGSSNRLETERPNTVGLPELPEGWCYTYLKPLLSKTIMGIRTGPFGSLLKKHEHRPEGIPVFGIENIKAMEFVPGSKIHITEDKAKKLSGYDAQAGDVIISRSGTVGEVCVIPEGIGEARISTNIMRVSLATGGMMPQFLCLLSNGSSFILNQISELCKGSTRDFLNQDILSSIIFPLPPFAEQHKIVEEIERCFSVADDIEKVVEQSLRKAERLRQSILKRAFEGKLVPQDPADEPAEELLKRIRAERAKIEAEKKATGKTRRS